MIERCVNCNARNAIRITVYNSKVCTMCGIEDFGAILSTEHAFGEYMVPLHTPATYTRVKRFRKYLQRASMAQSNNTIPEVTWDYLMKGAPYNGPANIVQRLKKAPKTVRKKCYDSLPLLVKLLCPHLQVPVLDERDKLQALIAFKVLDDAYCRGEPFVSYLFALEYILILIGRLDMVPYINKISCRRRRSEYKFRLDRVFSSSRCKPV